MKPKTSWIVCVGCNHDACGAIKSEVGGCSTGNRFVSFVRACARSGCLVELDLKLCWLPFYRFPFGLGELSLSPFAMEAPWRLVEARLCTGLQRFCIVKTMDFATSHMPWRLHGGSWRPVSVRASNAFALQKQWILQHLICHGRSMEARGGPSLYEPPPLLHCKYNQKTSILYDRGPPRLGTL